MNTVTATALHVNLRQCIAAARAVESKGIPSPWRVADTFGDHADVQLSILARNTLLASLDVMEALDFFVRQAGYPGIHQAVQLWCDAVRAAIEVPE